MMNGLEEVELVVVGGGMAGICAALAAARHGLKTALVEQEAVLGGASNSQQRCSIEGADIWGRRPNARETGILEELRLENAARNPDHLWEIWDAVLEEAVRREPNLTLHLETAIAGVEVGLSGSIEAVTARNNDETIHISSPLFADCTCDGALGLKAGADYLAMAEARAEFNESLAPEHRQDGARIRLLGDFVLCENDLREGRVFDDEAAYGGWPLSTGTWSDSRATDRPEEWFPKLYSIPFRSLYSRNVPNLLMAGPIVSATAVVTRSIAAQATGAAMGQAIGTAAAISMARGVRPREIAERHAWELQQKILKDDGYLIGHISEDPHDFARYSRAVATNKLGPDYIPSNVINGLTRTTADWPQLWASDPKIGFPTNIEIDFVERRLIDTVYLTFDTGLSRPLTLTDDPAYRSKMVSGPQPETVRDYTLLAGLTTRWNPIVEVRGNTQRRRVHRFDPVRVNRLRVVVHKTNGVDHARIFEIRCYHEGVT